jgi:quinol monooxygenase YgiN
MILATLRIAVPPGCKEEIIRAFWPLLGPMRVEPGCLGCGLYDEIANTEVLYYVEEWDTSEQLERHMRSARYERLLALMETSAQPPILRYYVIAGVKGLEYLEAIRLTTTSPPSESDTP